MLTTIAYGLAIVLDLFIIFIGARFLLAPQTAAAGYGVPVVAGQGDAYPSAKGVRDIASGVIGLTLLAFVGAEAEAWFLVAVALVPLGDMLIVLRNGGARATA